MENTGTTKREREDSTLTGNNNKVVIYSEGNEIPSPVTSVTPGPVDNSSLLLELGRMMDTRFNNNKMDFQQAIGDVHRKIERKFESVEDKLSQMATKADMEAVNSRMDEHQRTVDELRSDLEATKERLERLDKKDKSNNLVFTNVFKLEDPREAVRRIWIILQVDFRDADIKRVSYLSTYRNGTHAKVLVEFSSKSAVGLIFKNIKKLGGHKIGVEHDLTSNELDARNRLLKLKTVLLDKSKKLKVYVTDTSIRIGSNQFTLRRGELVPKIPGVDVPGFFRNNYDGFDILTFLNSA